MSHQEVVGLVLRAVEYKESDLILTVLTEGGILTLSARGVRRKNAPLAAAAEVLCCSRMTLSKYQGRYSLKEADIIESFYPLREDLKRMALASYLADLGQMVAPEGDFLPLIFRALRVICKKERPLPLVKGTFELRILWESGVLPKAETCQSCNAFSSEFFLHPGFGTALCPSCTKDVPKEKLLFCKQDTLLALRHIQTSPEEKLFSFALGEEAQKDFSAFSEKCVLAHIEKPPSSLEYYLRIK